MQLMLAIVQADDADLLNKRLSGTGFELPVSTPWAGSWPAAT